MSNSGELYRRALQVTPGGVHSPVRSLKSVNEHPVFIDSAFDAWITDADGNRYVDLCMAFGPLILGHANPQVHQAAIQALDLGWSYGAAESASLELAELITGSVPWVESIRFVNSGTEAVMSALRVARAATGRDKLLKFAGCYHGHTDAMLINSGSGLAETATADSDGIPAGVMQDTLVAPLDDIEALQKIFSEHGDELAAAIIEPLPANYGLLPQTDEFLKKLRELCTANNTVLIFDEVITGFRLEFRGYAGLSGITPDLVTYGKVIGGGFPVGAFGGKRELMETVAPAGGVYQAGTLSANPVAMKAGLATLQQLIDGEIYSSLEQKGAFLEAALNETVTFQRCGSLFWICAGSAQSAPLRSITGLPSDTAGNYKQLFQAALAEGLYLPPSAYEIGFLSAAHDEQQLQSLANAVNTFFSATD